MRLLPRRRPQIADTSEADRLRANLDQARDRLTAQRAEQQADKMALIERLSTRYYAAHAIVAHDHARGIVGTNSHLIGVCSGISESLAEVTGLDPITVGFRLDRGIPVTEKWVTVNDAPVGAPPDIRLLHDGIREPADERLDRLHREALKASGHPMYTVIYGDLATV